MIDKLLLKIRERHGFSDEEEQGLRSAMGEVRRFAAEEIITPQGEPVGFSSLLLEGLACRSKYLEDGERQITEIDVPGDFVDLHSYPLERLDHSVTALTACTIVKLPHEAIADLVVRFPRLGKIFWFSTLVDASIHREWLVSLGRRSALQRIAHLFCELYRRLRLVELTEGTSYDLPITQMHLAEALGLTAVHVNRMLRELAEKELATFRRGRVNILDLPRLETLAGFELDYLFLDKGTPPAKGGGER